MSGLLRSLKSRWDESDAASQLTYVGGWVGYGNPAQAYVQLMYLFAGFVDLCDQHGIEYWLDWGSLLGFLRHGGGIIPWDYDHDVGLRSADYNKFIAVIEKMQADAAAAAPAAAAAAAAAAASSSSSSSSSSTGASASVPPSLGRNTSNTFVLSDFTFERKGERGYYVMSLASHPEIQIDLVEYLDHPAEAGVGNGNEVVLKHNMDDDTYSGFYYPDYALSWVFPLRRVNMLGFSTLIPREPELVTISHFGRKYMDYLWVPYLLTKLYNPFLTATLWRGPVREVPVASSILEGMARYGASSPFLVHKPAEFSAITFESLAAFARGSNQHVFGYDSAGEMVEGLSVSDLFARWSADQLDIKVLDAPLQGVAELPRQFVELDVDTPEAAAEAKKDKSVAGSNRNAANAGLGLMMNKSNAYTFLHLDPPFYGGGWMYLTHGVKNWQYVAPQFVDLLYDPASKRLRDLPVSELVSRFGWRLHGQVLSARAEAGDFVYFPPCWMHRVRSYEKGLGVSGYMKLKQCHADMNKYTQMLEKKGLNSIWNGNDEI